MKRQGLDAAAIEALLATRTAARAAKDFAAADDARAKLTALGVEVLDTPGGSDWRVQDTLYDSAADASL